MRLLIDQNLPRALVGGLGEAGHDVVHAADVHLERASDPEVFSACVGERRVLVTADKKLTKFLAMSEATEPSVVVVRGFAGSAGQMVEVLLADLELVEETVSSRGHAVFSIGPDRPARVQLLPLGGLGARQ